jgi:hypothetical protein
MNIFGKQKQKLINLIELLKMANSPNPEYIPSIMYEQFGTVVLITNPKSDIYLKSVNKLDLRNCEKIKKVQ